MRTVLVIAMTLLCGAALANAPMGAPPAPAMQAVDPNAPLYAQLPPEIRKAGVLRFVGDSHPPYRNVSDDRQIRDGIDVDLARALERVLGVPARHYVVNSLSATLGGLEAGRYDVAMGPGVATKERLVRFDAVSWLYTKPSFVFPLQRPARYGHVEDLCGRKLAYVAGSVTERVAHRVTDRCTKSGKPAVQHVPLVDGNMTLVATQAGRADAAGMTMTAALHAAQVNPELFGVFGDEENALGIDLVGLFVTKRSGLAPVLLAAMQALHANGEYVRIMNKWGITAVSVKAPQMNAAK
jgi:polar amino acid transport system substrate-binding protein